MTATSPPPNANDFPWDVDVYLPGLPWSKIRLIRDPMGDAHVHYLKPSEARDVARRLLAAADDADGGGEERT